jgi:hypothetical protein
MISNGNCAPNRKVKASGAVTAQRIPRFSHYEINSLDVFLLLAP